MQLIHDPKTNVLTLVPEDKEMIFIEHMIKSATASNGKWTVATEDRMVSINFKVPQILKIHSLED